MGIWRANISRNEDPQKGRGAQEGVHCTLLIKFILSTRKGRGRTMWTQLREAKDSIFTQRSPSFHFPLEVQNLIQTMETVLSHQTHTGTLSVPYGGSLSLSLCTLLVASMSIRRGQEHECLFTA
ncbi:hypothetical protein SAY86_025608 [Trapa natans]|uniref:Uncharacterized protein n=1 Tax=Trapa natans TaxID=22666 RepID=A0AAN7MXS0_TRANT|nr:hypothetical protein SAY86_025608 [Trapa natans]